MTRRFALLMTVLALVATACGTGQELAEVETVAAPAPVLAETAPAPDSGDGEGIKVHGHWTIEVRDPDGTLDQRVEFENALTASGAELLAILLGTPDSSLVTMNVLGQGTGSLFDEALPNDCSPNFCFFDPVSRATEGDRVVLVGAGTADVSGQLDSVRTNAVVNAPGDNPSSEFTFKTLDSPVLFVEGQHIEITVEISFS